MFKTILMLLNCNKKQRLFLLRGVWGLYGMYNKAEESGCHHLEGQISVDYVTYSMQGNCACKSSSGRYMPLSVDFKPIPEGMPVFVTTSAG